MGRTARLSGHGQSPVAQLIPCHARERCARWTAVHECAHERSAESTDFFVWKRRDCGRALQQLLHEAAFSDFNELIGQMAGVTAFALAEFLRSQVDPSSMHLRHGGPLGSAGGRRIIVLRACGDFLGFSSQLAAGGCAFGPDLLAPSPLIDAPDTAPRIVLHGAEPLALTTALPRAVVDSLCAFLASTVQCDSIILLLRSDSSCARGWPRTTAPRRVVGQDTTRTGTGQSA